MTVTVFSKVAELIMPFTIHINFTTAQDGEASIFLLFVPRLMPFYFSYKQCIKMPGM